MRSWDPQQQSLAKPRTLAIYIDLSKCQALTDVQPDQFTDFEHVFVAEFCDAIAEEISRSWPAVNMQPTFFTKLFQSAEQMKASETRALLSKLAVVLQSGLPRVLDRSGKVDTKEIVKRKTESELSAMAKASAKPEIPTRCTASTLPW